MEGTERDMLEDVMEVCGELGSLNVAPVAGQLMGVLHDGRWVRAVVEKVEDDGVWLHGVDHVCYLERKLVSYLTHLPEVSMLVPAQCKTVRLVTSKLDRRVVDKVFSVKLRGEKNGFTKVELFLVDNEEVRDQRISEDRVNNEMKVPEEAKLKEIDTEDGISLVRKTKQEEVLITDRNSMKLLVGQMMDLTILHAESPTAVYLCPVQSQLKKLQKQIYRAATALKFDPEFAPIAGSIVLARSMTDGYWYRAKVISCTEGRVKFFCPDFGFTEEVQLDNVRMITNRLRETFVSKEFLACKCVLKDWREGTDPSTEVETAAIKKILLVSAEMVQVRVVEEMGEVYVVDIPGICRKNLNKDGGGRRLENLKIFEDPISLE